jgi:hypothetical protein
LTVPAIELVFWACATAGSSTKHATPAINRANVRIQNPPQTTCFKHPKKARRILQ